MEIFNAAWVALFLLLSGDFIGTFFYHVPEHIFGKYHNLIHHSNNRSFIHYAVLTRKPLVLFNGFLAAFPYLIFIPLLWGISPIGSILGLALAECHVVWRHISIAENPTPVWISRICNQLCITTPERHSLHHQDANVAYGDIFTFYDRPAQAWYRVLLLSKRKFSKIKNKSRFFTNSL